MACILVYFIYLRSGETPKRRGAQGNLSPLLSPLDGPGRKPHLALHDFLDDVEHASGGGEDEDTMVLFAEVLHQSDHKDHLARLLDQKLVPDVTNVKQRRVLGHDSIQRVYVHSAQNSQPSK